VLRGRETEEDVCRTHGITSTVLQSWERELLCAALPPDGVVLETPDVTAPARIIHDRWGVSHCYGSTIFNLFFAVGVAQARDRLWQLDYRRRFVLGALAEVMGPQALETDLEHRTLGFGRIVEDVEMPSLGDEPRAALAGYSAGVNAWIERVRGRLPVEFEILDYEPSPWRPVDSLAILRYFWWTLTGRLQQLVGAERLIRATSPEVAEWFLTPETVELIVPREEGETTAFRGTRDGTESGSNNWVAGPGTTTTGRPVLAADPHWALALPDMWYEQHLGGAGFDCIGPAFPGVPPIVFGRTRGASWGRTNNVTSTRDLYHERVNPEDANEYWAGASWERFRVIEEAVKVKGRDPVVHRIRFTERGPVVNDIIPSVEPDGDEPIALRWVGQERIGDMQALLDLSRAQTAGDIRDVLSRWRMSVWNAVYADTGGDFGYQMCGSIPVREVVTRGTRPATREGHDWTGYVGTADLPGLRSPDRGWVASANNPPGCQLPLYGTYADSYRFSHIRRHLSTDAKLSPEEVGGLQADNLDIRAEDLKDAVAARLARSGEPRIREMAETLRTWNARYDLDQIGATLWAALWPRWVQHIGDAVLPEHVAELNAANAGRLARHLLLGETVAFYTDDVDGALGRVALDALGYLRSALGPDAGQWQWGRANMMRLRHPLATNPSAARVFNPQPLRCSGGAGVVNNRRPVERENGFENASGASYRLVVDLSETDRAVGCMLAGQSAQPGSRHYEDQSGLWPEGNYHPLLMDRAEIEANAESTTRLQSAG